MPNCSFEGCTRRYKCKGFCNTHYRQHRAGKILYEPSRVVRRPPRMDKAGYVYVWSPKHPNAQSAGWLLEHRKIMADFLGRPLYPGENVHHVNGVRTDNRLENLELWVSSQPSGQRPSDLVAWAKIILERYDT